MPTLTPEAWAQIRYDYEHTDRPVADICADYGISSGTLRDRMRRWHWRRRRRSPIPREGPPAFLVVEQQSAGPERAVIVVEPSAPALQEAVTTVLPAVQRTLTRLAEGRVYPDDAAKTARALETLTRTLRALSGLSARQPRRR